MPLSTWVHWINLREQLERHQLQVPEWRNLPEELLGLQLLLLSLAIRRVLLRKCESDPTEQDQRVRLLLPYFPQLGLIFHFSLQNSIKKPQLGGSRIRTEARGLNMSDRGRV